MHIELPRWIVKHFDGCDRYQSGFLVFSDFVVSGNSHSAIERSLCGLVIARIIHAPETANILDLANVKSSCIQIDRTHYAFEVPMTSDANGTNESLM